MPDLNKNLIASTIIIGQGMPNKFSSFSPSGRKELLERLTKSDFMIEDIKVRVAARQAEVNAKLREFEDTLLVKNNSKTTIEKEITTNQFILDNDVVPDYAAEIEKANKEISDTDNKLIEINNQLSIKEAEKTTADSELLSTTNEIAKIKSEEYEEYSNRLNKIIAEDAKVSAAISSLEKEIKRIKAIKDVCPTCGQKLPGIEKPSTAEQESALEAAIAEKGRLKEAADACRKSHAEHVNQIDAHFAESVNLLKAASNKADTEIKALKMAISELNNQKMTFLEKLNKFTYDRDNHEKYVAGIKDLIVHKNAELNDLTAAIATATSGKNSIIDHIAVLRKIDTLIKRDFRGFLLYNIIDYIDKKAKEYCNTVFGTRELNVYLDGNDLDISYCGKMFDNLSGGEKQRVDLMLQFAIRDMLTSYLNVNSNILVLDEITDFLDRKSCGAIIKLIENELNTTESVFIISHHADELEIPVDSELHVIKNENGISEVK